jgi:hypothetical protein
MDRTQTSQAKHAVPALALATLPVRMADLYHFHRPRAVWWPGAHPTAKTNGLSPVAQPGQELAYVFRCACRRALLSPHSTA